MKSYIDSGAPAPPSREKSTPAASIDENATIDKPREMELNREASNEPKNAEASNKTNNKMGSMADKDRNEDNVAGDETDTNRGQDDTDNDNSDTTGESDTADAIEQQELGARLREAREYIGLLQEDVAQALGIPRASVSTLESGKRRVSSLELRRFARLYRRPVGWLLGEELETEFSTSLSRATAPLSDNDKEQVLRFAEFLAGAGRPGMTPRNSDNE
ncbi:MAG: helix-turn-helix transcriptional regulator [Acidimicrobiaceae bacterium]|nr:helix-turn-helix transcriptional regulator [Acidimicrobiaceae bacterium]